MVDACYRYVVLGILVAALIVITACAIEALAPDNSAYNSRVLSLLVVAAVVGSLVSHVYDNKGVIKLPDIKSDEIHLAVLGDVLIGILAAFAAIYLLHATLKADPELYPGIALLAGLTGTRLIPGFRDSIARQLKTLEEDVKEGERNMTARDYHQWGELKAGQQKYLEAIVFYEYALDADAKYTPVFSSFAEAYLHLAEEADAEAEKKSYMNQALADSDKVVIAAGRDAERLGGAHLQRANILQAMGKGVECAESLKKGVDHFKAAKTPDDRILAFVMANEYLKAAKDEPQIKAIIDPLRSKAESRT